MAGRRGRKIIIGITGGLGTGKTTVARIFGSLGVKVLDADRMAHEAVKKGTASYKKIVSAFGGGILDKSGRILFKADIPYALPFLDPTTAIFSVLRISLSPIT